jgi:hypothetical protein
MTVYLFTDATMNIDPSAEDWLILPPLLRIAPGNWK